jgi:hypothetical protein
VIILVAVLSTYKILTRRKKKNARRKLEQEVSIPTTESKTILCLYCGTLTDISSAYCGKCGARLDIDEETQKRAMEPSTIQKETGETVMPSIDKKQVEIVKSPADQDQEPFTRIPETTKTPKKAAKKVTFSAPMKSERSTEELREIEKTEREIYIQDQEELCQVHKGPLTGMTYVCPRCKTKYCVKCATALANRREGCWVCNIPIQIKPTEEQDSRNKDPLDNSRLRNLFDMQKFSESRGVTVTLLSKDFLKKLEQLDWEESDKQEFIKEMLALSPEKRERILDEMIDMSRAIE